MTSRAAFTSTSTSTTATAKATAAAAATPRARPATRGVLAALGALLLAACGAIPGMGTAPAPAPPTAAAASAQPAAAPAAVAPAVTSPAPAAAAAAPPPVLAFDDAVMAAASTLLGRAQLPPDTTFDLVIDPLIDGVTGQQTQATRAMGARIVKIIK